MKTRPRAIRLHKETLRDLDARQLLLPRGAGAAAPAPISQAGDSCLQSCFINTCYDTCQWELTARRPMIG
jgi:hypothetical protein